MGLMDQLPMPADPGRLIVTPHPVLLDGQRNMACDLRPGESLYAFLHRHVDGLDGQAWAVTIGGRQVPRHLWHHVYPKHGQVIELRGAVGKSALSLVALVALTYFTFGFGTATAGMWGAGAVSSAWGGLAATGVYMAGSMLINKVLSPKVSIASSTAESVYSLSSAQNRARPYEPLGLLFGAIRVTPDLASAPYTFFEGDDQYLAMVLTPGINVDRIDALYNGDTLLSSYEGVTAWHSGYSGMPEQTIPLYSNADTAQGGTLIDTSTDPKHTAGAWIERTSSAETIRMQVDIEFVLYDTTSKGKPKHNYEIFNLQYRPTGSSTWLTWGNFAVNNSTQKTRRVTYGRDVALGQYDVRVRVQGQNTDGKGASCNATWNTLTSIQQDTASYAGIPRTGIKIKATGQLNGALQEVRGKAYAKPLQLWDGSAWQTVTEPGANGISNPGAQILYYARGIRDDDGTLIGGMGLDDDMIDIEALKAFMPYCTENDYRYDYWITDARSHSDVLDKIALNGMGEITWAGGKLSVVWAGAEQPLSGVVNMATIKKGTFQVDYALANAADGIEYSYTDPDTLETKTLRVAAPGITTMLNPAQVAGEGITSETHAARMARWHLAQSLYQFKSIGFDTDLEHLSYRRLSVLALQHDLTQWGYGGRVRAAVNAGGTVTLTLDEPVPAPATGNAYIGLRIPGEAVYRVFAIQPFTGETTSITLADAWPGDAAVPGDSDGNPAWDTIWIYDFKQTPGYRVRVTGIEPESDLKGASISVVPEGPEFWTYVLTGAYIPAPNQSLLPTRPVASNLRVTERNVIQGDTVYTELQVTFDISGRAINTVVSCDVDGDGQLDEVAQTVTRSASFRIPGAGSYTILVRPYDEDGNAGVPATIIYVTASADQPPVLVDTFTVEAIDGGLRRYTWGFAADTIQSPDFAGVEIRYTAGAATAPDWDNMTPLGDSGFHTAAFESAAPAAGEWTFACRSRNTSGMLSTGYRLQTVTLPANVGEVIGGIDTAIEQHTAELVAAQAAVDQEIADRLAGDLNAVQTAADDATAKANAARDAAIAHADAIGAQAAQDATNKADAARDAAIAHADVIGAQVADIIGADEWVTGKDYPKGDLVKHNGTLYRALRANNSVEPGTSENDWQLIGNYDSLGEAVAASISMGTANASAIVSEAQQLDAVQARMPAGAGQLATQASVATEQQARVDADNALGSRTSTIEGRMPTGTDKLANEARVVTAENASVTRDNALGQRIGVVEARMPAGNGGLATSASVVDESTARAQQDQALGERIGVVEARMPDGNGGLATSASVVDEATARAQQDQALGERIGVVETTLPGKADASALTALQGQVTEQGDTITAQGSAITAVKASLPGGSGNLIPNASFEADISGWNTGWSDNGKGASYVRDAGGASVVPTGCHTIGIQPSGATTGTAYLDGPTIAIDPSKRYCYSGYLMSQRASASIRMFAITLDNHETELSPDSEPEIWPADITCLPDWKRQAIFYQPTSAVRYLRVSFRQNATGGSGPFSSLCRPMLEVASADQTEPSAWAPSAAGIDSKYASVTQSMQAQVTSQGNTIAAQGTALTAVEARMPAGNGGLATSASVVDEATARAQQDQALGERIGVVETTLPGKADASALTALQGQVTEQGNTITAQGTALTAVKASLPSGSGNLIPNAAFEADLSGWSTGWSTNGKGASYVRDAGGASVVPTGCHTIGIQPSGATTGTAYLDGPTIAIDPSKRYCYSGYLMSQRASASIRMFAITLDNQETEISPAAEPEISPADTTVLSNWQRQAIFYQPTSAVRYLRVSFRQNATGGSGPFSSLCRPMLEVASADQTEPSAWAPSAAGIDSKYASVTQSMQAQVTGQGNNIASILAQYFLAVNADGKVAGMKIGSNGTTGSVEFLADIFRVIASGNAGMEWQANYLRTYGSEFQLIIGTGFGANGNLAMWFGPNVGAAACTIDNAISCSTISGYQQTSGVIKGGLLSASAIELGSTRIHVGDGRLAPFSVQDMSFSSINGSGWQNFTQTVDGFVGPGYGSGYHAKRFAAQRMDVFIDVLCAGSRNTETVALQVQYDGGSWSTITSVDMDVSNKAMIPLMIRYTTLDTWNTVAFRARTTSGNSQALSIKVNIWNYNESGNAAGSNSGTTGSGSGSGSLPPGNGGGGGAYCVDWDTVLPDGRFARDLRVGDLVECVDVPTGTREWIALRAIDFGQADCYRVSTAHGEVIQSDTTPMVMRDGSILLTPALAGHELLTHAHGFEVCALQHVGMRDVVKVDFGNRMFFAGTRRDNAIATHNIKIVEP